MSDKRDDKNPTAEADVQGAEHANESGADVNVEHADKVEAKPDGKTDSSD